MNKFCLILALYFTLTIAEATNTRHVRSIPAKNAREDDDDDDSDGQEADSKATSKPKAPAAGANQTEKLEPVTIGSFRGFVHGVDSSDVIVMDEKTLEIPDFSYDGEGPASWFVVGNEGDYWKEMVDLGEYTVIPDEIGSCESIRRYSSSTVRLTLPGKLTVNDISYVSVYCLRFNHNFGYVTIPDDLKVPKAGKYTRKVEECENVESGESESSGPDRPGRPRPPPRRPGGPSSSGSGSRPQESSGSLLGGLLNLLG